MKLFCLEIPKDSSCRTATRFRDARPPDTDGEPFRRGRVARDGITYDRGNQRECSVAGRCRRRTSQPVKHSRDRVAVMRRTRGRLGSRHHHCGCLSPVDRTAYGLIFSRVNFLILNRVFLSQFIFQLLFLDCLEHLYKSSIYKYIVCLIPLSSQRTGLLAFAVKASNKHR